MKNLALVIFAIIIPFIMLAQSATVKGHLVDSSANQVLDKATISILYLKDSSLVDYTITNEKGNFIFKSVKVGEYVMIISYTGYEPLNSILIITKEKNDINLGEIKMQRAFKTLEGVVVKDPGPVRMNGDTISFKASAFNTKPDATVEDVLKKIPGVQVQKDGTIKAMGEQVQKVYVDGKEFFGNDPKMATRNLTANMVDQIQVFEDMSEQAKFTKIDDGSKTKSINIKLKKESRKGDFGKASLGIGSDSRYDGNISYNHFRGDRRMSLVGSANNTNKANYTFNDASSNGISKPGISAGGIASNGISRPINSGLNLNDTWGPKIDFRASYYYSDNKNILLQDRFRVNMFPGDSSSEISTNANYISRNKNHRINARWEYTIDSVNSILYTANFNGQIYNGANEDSSITNSVGIYKYLAARASTIRKDSRKGINYFGELLYRRRFGKPGRTLTIGWRNNIGKSNGNSLYNSPVTTYNYDGVITSSIDLDQKGFQDFQSGGNTISSSYTEPIGLNKLVELNYAYSINNNESEKRTYDFNSGSGKYDQMNMLLSNSIDYKNSSNRFGFNFRHQLKKINYQFGMGIQFSELQNSSFDFTTGKDSLIRQNFTNLFPTANFNFAFTRSKNIRIYYRGRTNAPTVTQLQDNPDVSNPLIIKTGNPSLKQEFVNNLNITYNSYSTTTQQFFSANVSVTYTGNKIVNSIDSLGSYTLLYKPENMQGSFNSSGMASVYLPLKKVKGLNLNLTTLTYLGRDANLFYKKRNFTTIFQVNQSAGINYGQENFDLAVSSSVIYNLVSYQLDQGSGSSYFSQAYSADMTYRFKNRIYFLTDIDYYISSGRTDGFNKGVFLWNLSLARKFLKANAAEFKFTVYDLLKQNNGISRTLGENYFEDIRSNVIPRFFLVTVSYNLNRVGAGRSGNNSGNEKMDVFK